MAIAAGSELLGSGIGIGALCDIIWLLLLGPDRFILPGLCSCAAILFAARGRVTGAVEK